MPSARRVFLAGLCNISIALSFPTTDSPGMVFRRIPLAFCPGRVLALSAFKNELSLAELRGGVSGFDWSLFFARVEHYHACLFASPSFMMLFDVANVQYGQ